MSKFDLANLDTTAAANGGMEMQLVHPVSNEPLDAFITLAGADSEIYRKTQHKIADERIKKRGRAPDSETLALDVTRLIAACTLGWRGITVDGEDRECNAGNAVNLYNRFLWMREQAANFIEDRRHFLPK